MIIGLQCTSLHNFIYHLAIRISTTVIISGLQYVNYASDVRMHDLSGRLVLLDFFTYCCINCIHIMPALHELESLFSISDAMLVIGIHSAKFQNEKASIRNI